MSEIESSYVTPSLARWRRATDGPLLVIAIASLPLLVLDLSRPSLTHGDRVFLDVVNIFVLIVFAVDYGVELTLSRPRREYVRGEWTSLLIVVTQAFAVIPALNAFGFLRILRGGRAVRALVVIGRTVAIGGAAAKSGKEILLAKAGRFALTMAAFTWLCSAVAFTMVEDVGEGGRIESFWDSLWWATSTITTVGYGDIYPVTRPGRIVGGITMVVGISTFAIVTAKLAEVLNAARRERHVLTEAHEGSDNG